MLMRKVLVAVASKNDKQRYHSSSWRALERVQVACKRSTWLSGVVGRLAHSYQYLFRLKGHSPFHMACPLFKTKATSEHGSLMLGVSREREDRWPKDRNTFGAALSLHAGPLIRCAVVMSVNASMGGVAAAELAAQLHQRFCDAIDVLLYRSIECGRVLICLIQTYTPDRVVPTT